MNWSRRALLVLGPLAGLALLAGCHRSRTPQTGSASSAAGQNGGSPSAPALTGERTVGKASLEVGYDATTGSLIYTQTREETPPPAGAATPAVAPLWLVVYPPGSTVASTGYHLNCEGVPGNCPDHNALVAGVATRTDPTVYGSDSTAVPGHDHLFASPGNEAAFDSTTWELNVVVFTPQAKTDGAIDTHLTTEAQLQKAKGAGDVQVVDLHATIHTSMVPAAMYAKGTPVSGAR